MIGTISVILTLGLNLLTDAVKTYLSITGRQELWEKYSPLIPKVMALLGFLVGIVVSLMYDLNMTDTLNTLGLTTISGLGATGLDMAFKGASMKKEKKDTKVFFNTVEVKDKE